MEKYDINLPDQNSNDDQLHINKKIRFLLFYLFPFLVFIMLASAIYITRLKIDHSIIVYLTKNLLSGEKTAGRISVYHNALGYLNEIESKIWILNNKRKILIFSGKSQNGSEAVDVEFVTPKLKNGLYDIIFEIDHPFGNDVIKRKIKISSKIIKSNLYKPAPLKDRPIIIDSQADFETWKVSLISEGGSLVTSFKNIVFIKSQFNNGDPFSAKLCLSLGAGEIADKLDNEVDLNKFGISAFYIYPIQTIIGINVRDCSDYNVVNNDNLVNNSISSKNSKLIYIPTSPGQLLVRVHNPLAIFNSDTRFGVVSLIKRSPFYCDIYNNGYWKRSKSSWIINGAGQIRMNDLDKGINFIQMYSSISPLERGVSGRHFYVKSPDETDYEAIKNIISYVKSKNNDVEYMNKIDELISKEDDNLNLLAAFLLGNFDNGYYKPPLFVDTQSKEQQNLEKFQKKFRIFMAVGFGLLGLIIIGIFILLGIERVKAYKIQKQQMQEIMNDNNIDSNVELQKSRPYSYKIIFQIILGISIIAVVFILLGLLVSLLEWRY